MTEFHCGRSDWLPTLFKADPGDIVRIHPLDGLTYQDVYGAMVAQGMIKHADSSAALWDGYRVTFHGTVALIQKRSPR